MHSATRWTAPNFAFAMLAQLFGPQANEREMMGATVFTNNDERRTLTLTNRVCVLNTACF